MLALSLHDITNYHVRQKNAPFYVCKSYVKTLSIMTVFGTHILQ